MSLSRLAIVALSWSDLAGEYPTGPEGFPRWLRSSRFDAPAVGPGPRLIMVAGDRPSVPRPVDPGYLRRGTS